ncbi:cell division protein FtsK [Herbidospora sp. NEAU-GS84]|uniref:Cell division protein FtsK n=1 Tax=Herbidospora solisilvae TaxID=2696284 RepID=A0A7C9N1H8_9ACTN|nr:FtsK/SpoIIIE domain-containing protein [Herbidospora solisilvae]NAS21574.1 cell division protein FtsK [Herbidospora solisilvae]
MTDLLDSLAPIGVVLAFVAALLVTWRYLHQPSFWLGIGYPLRAMRVYLTWPSVAAGCGLTTKRRRLRRRLDGVEVLNLIATGRDHKRRVHRVAVDKAPWLGLVLPLRHGFKLWVRLPDGHTPDHYAAKLDHLAHAWRVHSVRVLGWKPGKVQLQATVYDPLTSVSAPIVDRFLKVCVGRLETNAPWVIDFLTVPHWLITGATQSGKSTLINRLICGLAPQRLALIGCDLKGGVELTPYEDRLTALATDRAQMTAVLNRLVDEIRRRMAICRDFRVRNIWQLPESGQPIPIVVFVDEVAELFLMADKSEKDEIAATATNLIRIAQLGRAFGVYLVICGQRVGSDLGPGVTALRAQLSGRVCHRVNDPETANMTLGDMDPAALNAARLIPAETPGLAVVTGSDGRWYRARSEYVTEQQAEQAAVTYAHMTPTWADITTVNVEPVGDDEFDQYAA